jgi:hypothetical protein
MIGFCRYNNKPSGSIRAGNSSAGEWSWTINPSCVIYNTFMLQTLTLSFARHFWHTPWAPSCISIMYRNCLWFILFLFLFRWMITLQIAGMAILLYWKKWTALRTFIQFVRCEGFKGRFHIIYKVYLTLYFNMLGTGKGCWILLYSSILGIKKSSNRSHVLNKFMTNDSKCTLPVSKMGCKVSTWLPDS